MLVNGAPLFPGYSQIETLFKVFQVLGTPAAHVWPEARALPHFDVRFPVWRPQPLRAAVGVQADRLNDAGVELIMRCLAYRPSERPTAREALRLSYFDGFDSSQIGQAPLPGHHEA